MKYFRKVLVLNLFLLFFTLLSLHGYTKEINTEETLITFIPKLEFTIVSQPVDSKIQTEPLFKGSIVPLNQSFRHNIYDRNDVLICTIISNVWGETSIPENPIYNNITSISTTKSGSLASDFSTSISYPGQEGAVEVYFNNYYLSTFRYKIQNQKIINY